jgi:hypothetical protein
LKARSKAIRTALERYNAAAAELCRTQLNWDEVVEYAFLSDFDLLRDTRQDIRKRPWATPAGRFAMDNYFKLIRAQEEISRLNIETSRLATFMRDEDAYLRSAESVLQPTDAALAYQIQIHRMESSRFIQHHMVILNNIVLLKGYSGGQLLGVHADEAVDPSEVPSPAPQPAATLVKEPSVVNEIDSQLDLEEEQAGEDEEEIVIDAFHHVLQLSYDTRDIVEE